MDGPERARPRHHRSSRHGASHLTSPSNQKLSRPSRHNQQQQSSAGSSQSFVVLPQLPAYTPLEDHKSRINVSYASVDDVQASASPAAAATGPPPCVIGPRPPSPTAEKSLPAGWVRTVPPDQLPLSHPGHPQHVIPIPEPSLRCSALPKTLLLWRNPRVVISIVEGKGIALSEMNIIFWKTREAIFFTFTLCRLTSLALESLRTTKYHL